MDRWHEGQTNDQEQSEILENNYVKLTASKNKQQQLIIIIITILGLRGQLVQFQLKCRNKGMPLMGMELKLSKCSFLENTQQQNNTIQEQ